MATCCMVFALDSKVKEAKPCFFFFFSEICRSFGVHFLLRLKLLAMLVVFNSRAAAISTTLVSATWVCTKQLVSSESNLSQTEIACAWVDLQVLSPILAIFVVGLESSVGPMLLSYATFWIFLCFWQRIRQCFQKPLCVFMDKLCISQKDAHLKAVGSACSIYWASTFKSHSFA